MNIPGLHVCSKGEDTQTDRHSQTDTHTQPRTHTLMVMDISCTITYPPFVEFFNSVLSVPLHCRLSVPCTHGRLFSLRQNMTLKPHSGLSIGSF